MRIKRKTYLLWKRRLSILFIILCVFGVGYVFFRTHFFTVQTYEFVGVPEERIPSLQKKIATLAATPRFHIIPTNRIVTYRSKEVKEVLKEEISDLASVSIRVHGLHTLRISVTRYVPQFRLESGEAVTESGYIYTPRESVDTLPVLSIASSTTVIQMVNGIPTKVLQTTHGEIVATLLKIVTAVTPRIQDVLFPVDRIVITEDQDIFFEHGIPAQQVRILHDTAVDKVWSTIISAIDTEPLKSLLMTKKDRLEYIDARYGNKVFYRFTNTALPTIINASTTYVDTTPATTTIH